jgi:uncharacterized protein YecE (DUF72 family)
MPADKIFTPFKIGPDLTGKGFFIGTSGYYYDDWIGIFNPPKTRRKKGQEFSDDENLDQDRLRFYQKYFSFVEINNTFYTPPQLAHFLDIEKRSKPSMLYSVKVHRDISHSKTWNAKEGKQQMAGHILAVSPLVETGRFFGFLIQLEDHVFRSQERLDYLLAVAGEAVGRRISVHIELRHISWHVQNALEALKNAGVGICNTEIPPVKHAFPLKAYATSEVGYMRLSGRNLAAWYPEGKPATPKEKLAARNARYNYDYSEDEIKKRVALQLNLHQKVTKVAVAYNNHYQARAVANALTNLRILQKELSGASASDKTD